MQGAAFSIDLRQSRLAADGMIMISLMEEAMPMTDALILTAIVAAFVVFGLVLAWVDYQTRNIRPIIRPSVTKIDHSRSPTKMREAA
jgi:multisubunit Na+/H+ antiporter MnhC subunit